MRWFLLLCMLYLPATSASAQAITDDAKLKAALIYRFVQFTAWPSGSPDGLHYCVYGDEGVFHAMRNILADNVDKVSELQPEQSSEHCNVLYLAGNLAGLTVLPALSGENTVLTIAENAQIFRQGMVIGFITEPKRLSFRVNLQVAKQQGLTLSSQMLKLAKEIY